MSSVPPPEDEAKVPFTRKELDAGAPPDAVCKIAPTCHPSQAMHAAYKDGILAVSCRKCGRLFATFKVAAE